MSYGLWNSTASMASNLRGVPDVIVALPHAPTHVAIIAFLMDSGIPAWALKKDGGRLAVSTSASVPFVPNAQH